jgi:hypothetical protein
MKELTLKEIRAWVEFTGDPNARPDAIGELIIDGLTVREVGFIAGIAPDELENMAPSSIQETANEIIKSNPYLMKFRSLAMSMHGAKTQKT